MERSQNPHTWEGRWFLRTLPWQKCSWDPLSPKGARSSVKAFTQSVSGLWPPTAPSPAATEVNVLPPYSKLELFYFLALSRSVNTIFLADQRNKFQVDLETTFQTSHTATLQCSSLSYSTSLHLIVTPQGLVGRQPASHLLQRGLRCHWLLLLSFEPSTPDDRCLFSFQKTFLFCCSHFHSLSTLFSMITHTSAPAFSSFSSDFPVWLPLSNLFAHCHLIISSRVSPSYSTRSSRSTDFYLHFLLLFIFLLPSTLASMIP